MLKSVGEPARAPGRTGALVYLVLLTCGLPATVALSCLTPVLPKIEQALAQGPQDSYLVKMLAGAVGLAMVVGAPLAGFLSDRFGRRPVLVASFLLFAAFGVAGYFLEDLPSLVASRFLTGAAAAAALTVGLAQIGDRFDGEARHRLMGWNVTVSTVSAFAFIPAAGMLGEASWRGPFLLHLVGLPLALLALTLHAPRAPATVKSAQVQPKGALPWGLMAFVLVAGAICFAPVIFAPFRIRELGVESPSQMAFALTAKAVSTALAAAVFGHARKRLGPDQCFAVSFVLLGLGAAGMAYAQTLPVMIAGALVFGLGMGWVAPNVMSVAAGLTTAESRGRVIGAVKGVHLASSFAAVVALEPVSRLWGPDAALAAVAVGAGAMLLYSLARGAMAARPREKAA